MSEFTGYVKDKKLPVGRNPSSIDAYASIEDNGKLDTITPLASDLGLGCHHPILSMLNDCGGQIDIQIEVSLIYSKALYSP